MAVADGAQVGPAFLRGVGVVGPGHVGPALLVTPHLVAPGRIGVGRVLDDTPGVHSQLGSRRRREDYVGGGGPPPGNDAQLGLVPVEAVGGGGMAHEVGLVAAVGGSVGVVPHFEQVLVPVVEHRAPEGHRLPLPGTIDAHHRLQPGAGGLQHLAGESGIVLDLGIVDEQVQAGVMVIVGHGWASFRLMQRNGGCAAPIQGPAGTGEKVGAVCPPFNIFLPGPSSEARAARRNQPPGTAARLPCARTGRKLSWSRPGNGHRPGGQLQVPGWGALGRSGGGVVSLPPPDGRNPPANGKQDTRSR